MRVLLAAGMLVMLLRPVQTMGAASEACRLFVTAVLPGLFPYMVLSLMLVSRLAAGGMPGWLFLALGWGGGAPTGARLLPLLGGAGRKERVRLAVSCATMSPMFLLGTVGGWLGSGAAGAAALAAVLIGGWLTGLLAGAAAREAPGVETGAAPEPLTFGAAVEQAARTMLLVCGTIVMLRVASGMASGLPSGAELTVTALLEVTAGCRGIAALPLPLPLRTALIAGACGFGGMAIMLQNRAVLGETLMSPGAQLLWQLVHGGLSFLLALGLMLLAA